jgi:hypothetical protein
MKNELSFRKDCPQVTFPLSPPSVLFDTSTLLSHLSIFQGLIQPPWTLRAPPPCHNPRGEQPPWYSPPPTRIHLLQERLNNAEEHVQTLTSVALGNYSKATRMDRWAMKRCTRIVYNGLGQAQFGRTRIVSDCSTNNPRNQIIKLYPS